MSRRATFWDDPEWVDEDIIRDAFNEGQFFERASRGDLRRRTLDYNNHLNRRQREKLGERKCTRSQTVGYYEPDGGLVALVHQYRRRDGSLRGGRPDPKRLVYQGRTLAIRQSQ